MSMTRLAMLAVPAAFGLALAVSAPAGAAGLGGAAGLVAAQRDAVAEPAVQKVHKKKRRYGYRNYYYGPYLGYGYAYPFYGYGYGYPNYGYAYPYAYGYPYYPYFGFGFYGYNKGYYGYGHRRGYYGRHYKKWHGYSSRRR